ncbi:DNA recombination protein RmuC [Candidatus Uhrbacteria bacterium]|nr:DNA recombination protein RmuC [Candidatus Uhrbacteria bacterium]
MLLIITLLVALSGGVFWLIIKLTKQKAEDPNRIDPQSMILLQNQINELSKSLDERMGDTHKAVRQNFAATSNIVRDVTEKITRMEETSKQVLDVTHQLQNLQDMLKSPKQRGILGEYYLETLLQNVLPPESYKMQYGFKDGEIVDAAVFVRDKIVPIDSKFSLENYNRMIEEQNPVEREKLAKLFIGDLKKRIQETSKYIRPEEGTMEFAFMFIPHEAIYYDLLINKIGAIQEDSENILQRAAGKWRVIIVSPTSFLAYLQTVLQGLKALRIEEQAQEIRKRVMDLNRHLAAYDQHFTSVGKHLGTAVNQYRLASKEFVKVDKDVLRITGESNNIEPIQIDSPLDDD